MIDVNLSDLFKVPLFLVNTFLSQHPSSLCLESITHIGAGIFLHGYGHQHTRAMSGGGKDQVLLPRIGCAHPVSSFTIPYAEGSLLLFTSLCRPDPLCPTLSFSVSHVQAKTYLFTNDGLCPASFRIPIHTQLGPSFIFFISL